MCVSGGGSWLGTMCTDFLIPQNLLLNQFVRAVSIVFDNSLSMDPKMCNIYAKMLAGSNQAISTVKKYPNHTASKSAELLLYPRHQEVPPYATCSSVNKASAIFFFHQATMNCGPCSNE